MEKTTLPTKRKLERVDAVLGYSVAMHLNFSLKAKLLTKKQFFLFFNQKRSQREIKGMKVLTFQLC